MTNNNNNQRTSLVLSSTGKTGRRVVDRLKNNNLPVREGSRKSEILFDWYDSSTWTKVLDNVSSVYVVFYPDLAVSGSKEIIQEFSEKAKSANVEHLVLLSGRGEEEAQACEQIVINSGLDWTIVRASWFAQNFSESFFLDDIQRGQVVVPFGDIKEPFIDVDDIADVVYASLTDEKHRGQIYEITGPDLLTFRDAIGEIAKAANREIELVQVSMDEYTKLLSDAKVPKDYIELLKYLFTEVLDGRNSQITDGVQHALGRGSRSFSEYAQETAASGIWEVANV